MRHTIFDPLYEAFKEISMRIRFSDVTKLGMDTNEKNNSNDVKKNVDILANSRIIHSLTSIPNVIAYISEEEEKLTFLPGKEHFKNGTIVVFDPLDGSKNVFSNITVGTLYGIYSYDVERDSITDIIETGYCLYGPSTILVKTSQTEKVGMFVLNAANCFDFVKEIKKPDGNKIYSINMSYDYEKDIHHFVNTIKREKVTQRWCGAIVSDAHQILMRGGTFIYPSSSNNPRGKIRYLYEALPLAYLFTVLDGTAVDLNMKNLLDKIPYIKLGDNSVHGETPIILSTYYSRKELKSIFEINDIIKC